MLALLVLAEAAAALPPDIRLAEIERAIDAGRVHQARTMLAAELTGGNKGPAIDRLLADLAFTAGDNAEAFARYSALAKGHPDDAEVVERAAIAGLKIGRIADAESLAGRASDLPSASWRAWNVHGVLADLRGDFEAAESSYQRALQMVPGQTEVLNNLGWSRLLRGDWEGAVAPLEEAVSLGGAVARTANNLELARAAVDVELPKRRPNEAPGEWAARLNDAGVVARLRGQQARAVAAFARAIEAREIWYGRAAANLKAVSASK